MFARLFATKEAARGSAFSTARRACGAPFCGLMKEEKKARLAHVLLQDLPGRCAGAGAGGGELHAQTGDARGELTDPPPFRRRALGDLAGVSCKELNPPPPSSIGQTLEGSFSAVSKRNFARKYAFESSRRDLHMHSVAPFSKLKFCFLFFKLNFFVNILPKFL